MSTCRSCKQKIEFMKTTAGKLMPVNPGVLFVHPHPKGKTTIVTFSGEVVRGVKVSHEDEITKVGQETHFATCPNASKHRSKVAVHRTPGY
ncbi:MAG: hypothetical protein ACRDDX_10465 [Cellulosilyticaceae bacterium]